MSTSNLITINDYANEKSSFDLTSITATAANLVAQQALAATLVAATEDLTIGKVVKQRMALIILDSPDIPTNVYAHRESKWLVSYVGDASGKTFQTEIAAPDLTDNLVGNSDIADLTSDDWVAFSDAFVAYVRSPDNGTETVTITKAELVGRNL